MGVLPGKIVEQSFSDWARANPALMAINLKHYFIDTRCVVDVFLRFEHLQEDVAALEKRVPGLAGLAGTFDGIKAKSNARPKDRPLSDYFAAAPDLVAAIRFFNKPIIDMFGYEPP